jgi:hypothetical protein
LLGISATSLVGSSLIKNEKSTKDVANENEASVKMKKPVRRLGDSGLMVEAADPANPKATDPVVARGVLRVNNDPRDSKWSDMFQSEEVGSAGHLALSKIQMFYFTLILVIAYAAALAMHFTNASGEIGDFPALDNSMIALLGISHATYLAGKSISSTNTN